MSNSSNLFDWNYRDLARQLPKRAFPLIDAHCHINGAKACSLYLEAAKIFGFKKAWSMSQLEEVDGVQKVLGDFIDFIAFPRVRGEDPIFDHGKGYIQRIEEFHKRGSSIMKLWTAPRIFDFCPGDFKNHDMRIDSAVRRPTIDRAAELGMKLMMHVADPDAWFKHTYRDTNHYGSKAQQYEMLEWLLQTYKIPTIACHMAGSPEDLKFLDYLLSKYSNLYLDTSAMKWVVRELSRHPTAELKNFFAKWGLRILFGTDIVTMDSHLEAGGEHEMARKAGNQDEAFDLYASRFWTMRSLFETELSCNSPVLDPDSVGDPIIKGFCLPETILESVYLKNAQAFLAQ